MYDDGNEMLTDENKNKVIEYQAEVDDEQYRLTSITTFTFYLEKGLKIKMNSPNKELESSEFPFVNV